MCEYSGSTVYFNRCWCRTLVIPEIIALLSKSTLLFIHCPQTDLQLSWKLFSVSLAHQAAKSSQLGPVATGDSTCDLRSPSRQTLVPWLSETWADLLTVASCSKEYLAKSSCCSYSGGVMPSVFLELPLKWPYSTNNTTSQSIKAQELGLGLEQLKTA